MKVNIYKLLLVVFGCGLALTSCKEDIDTSNRYTFTGETVTDYIAHRAEFSEYYRMLCKVPLSDFSKSSVAQLLSARGNYAVFAPTNDAIARYLTDSVAVKGIIPANTTSTSQIENAAVADSLERVIVYNSVINRGDNDRNFWYINDMCFDRYSELPLANMNGRYLTVDNPSFELVCQNCQADVKKKDTQCPSCGIELDALNKVEVERCRVSSGKMRWNIRNRDVEVFNGVIQEMDDVVAPSNDNIFEILTALGSDYITWASMMSLTGIADELTDPATAFEDHEYKQMFDEGVANFSGATDRGGFYTQPPVGTEPGYSILPDRRDKGFTIFAETNEVMASIGVMGTDETSMTNLKNYLQAHGAAGNMDNNYKSDDNIVRQWMLYHILPMRLTAEALVVHWNELGYNPYLNGVKKATIPISEYYQTYGKPYRLLKLTDGVNTGGVRLNRFWINNPEAKNAGEFEKEVLDEGILVNTKESQQALNGLVYSIDEVLVYSNEDADRMGSERIRFDITSLLPEMMTNKFRRLSSEFVHGRNMAFSVKNSKGIQYFERFISNNEDCRLNYLPGIDSNWKNMQGDEFNIEGPFDLTIQLPPVPKTGTYELRYGVSANGNRTMCQVYFGDKKNALPATGIPMDLRTGGRKRYASSKVDSYIGWENDGNDDAANQEVDKKMRNNGYMKAPATYAVTPSTNFSITGSLREAHEDCLRCILVRANMEAGKLYYVRFKDVLGKDKGQFFFDYMELCPKNIYDNPNLPEDKW